MYKINKTMKKKNEHIIGHSALLGGFVLIIAYLAYGYFFGNLPKVIDVIALIIITVLLFLDMWFWPYFDKN